MPNPVDPAARILALEAEVQRLLALRQSDRIPLAYLKDRFGPAALPPAELAAKWQDVYPDMALLWGEVDQTLGVV